MVQEKLCQQAQVLAVNGTDIAINLTEMDKKWHHYHYHNNLILLVSHIGLTLKH